MKIKIAITLLLLTISGCAESNFELSPDSRLPKWFSIPQGMSRSDLAVDLTYYIVPTEKSVFKMRDTDGKIISKVVGHRYGGYKYPKELKNPPSGFPDGYPSYEVIIYDGVIDIIEHKKMEPIFYTTDDPDVWEELVPKK